MITITDNAVNRISKLLQQRQSGIGLRVKVKATGCSGYAYVLEYVDQLNADDVVFDSNGINIIVDKESLVLIDGTELDYTKSGLNEVFKFNNPMEAAQCGCGESFTIKT